MQYKYISSYRDLGSNLTPALANSYKFCSDGPGQQLHMYIQATRALARLSLPTVLVLKYRYCTVLYMYCTVLESYCTAVPWLTPTAGRANTWFQEPCFQTQHLQLGVRLEPGLRYHIHTINCTIISSENRCFYAHLPRLRECAAHLQNTHLRSVSHSVLLLRSLVLQSALF